MDGRARLLTASWAEDGMAERHQRSGASRVCQRLPCPGRQCWCIEPIHTAYWESSTTRQQTRATQERPPHKQR